VDSLLIAEGDSSVVGLLDPVKVSRS